MRQRPKTELKTEADAPDDIGAVIASCAAFGFPVAPNIDHRRAAKFLYWAAWRLCDIAELMALPEGTLASWKSRDGWDKATPLEKMEGCTEARFVQLIFKTNKTGADYKEIDLLGRQAERFARVRRYGQPGGNEGDLNPKVDARNAGPKKKPRRNVITADMTAVLKQRFLDELFVYQEGWYDSSSLRTRAILKSRQIGATWYFAREALIDALETGRNQIFLSASKSQAHVFREYIRAFVLETVGVELSGDPIVIDRGDDQTGTVLEQPTLYFLGTNARTAQGYHGNFYFDEFFWVYGFAQLNKVASGMAMHKKWRKTYFSTPSSITHEAHGWWSGDDWNRRRPKTEKREFDTSWKATKDGLLLPDRIWRQTVTIQDAAAKGCDLFDLEELKQEYSAADYANLLMCEFVDDTLSVFPMRLLQTCQVDEWDAWDDIDWAKMALGYGRPYAGEVWLSYDPNGDGENADGAGLVLVAPPANPGEGKFRIIHKEQFKGSKFVDQAQRIFDLCDRYNVTKIDIDETGIGKAVLQLVQQRYYFARGHRYDPAVKTRMVLKTLDVIGRGRLEYPIGWTDLTAAMMSIRRALTGSGRHLTYEAPRQKGTGHADLAWAVFQALDNEPLEAAIGGGATSTVRIFYDD